MLRVAIFSGKDVVPELYNCSDPEKHLDEIGKELSRRKNPINSLQNTVQRTNRMSQQNESILDINQPEIDDLNGMNLETS